MPQVLKNQRGFAPILIVVVLLLLGLGLGVYLVSQRTNISSKASVSTPVSPQTSFILQSSGEIVVGKTFTVTVVVRSDIDTTNLYNAQIKFPVSQLEVVNISTTGTFIDQWAEQFYDNTAGEISLVGGASENGGAKSVAGSPGLTMATITFKAKQAGPAVLTIADESEIYRSSDSVNILVIKGSTPITIAAAPTPTPVPVATVTVTPNTVDYKGTITVNWSNISNPTLGNYVNIISANNFQTPHSYWINNNCTWFTPSTGTPKSSGSCTIDLSKEYFGSEFTNPFHLSLGNGSTIIANSNNFTITGIPTPVPSTTPSPTPAPIRGDGNNDGKVNLADLSVLFKNYGKRSDFPPGLDLNNDGVINTFDFGDLKTILIQLKILRG